MSVTVGFAPATTPGLVTGGASAAGEGDAPEGLFAALLAMLAPAADAGTIVSATGEATTAAEEISSTDFTALIQTLVPGARLPPRIAANGKPSETPAPTSGEAVEVTLEPITEANQSPTTHAGKSLLKDLGDALVAINDAAEAGKPVDPALEDKLDEALEALAALLGTTLPTAPVVDPTITALATGEGLLPSVDAAAPPALTPGLPATPAEADPAPAGSAIETAAPAPSAAPADFVDALLAATGTEAETKPADTTLSETTTVEEAPQALRDLGLLIGKLAERLEPKDPVLANKLAALSGELQSGAASDALLATLGIESADTDADLKRIIDALGDTKTAAIKPAEAQPFTTPLLTSPLSKKDATAEAAPVATAPPELESAPIEVSKPAPTTTSAAATERDTAPTEKPAPPAANPAASDGAAAATGTPPAQQPAAAPVARTIHAAYQAPVQQVNLPQVAFEVVRQFDAGNSRFQIRLDPPELGRIDVKLDVDKAGTVNARMVVERPETLDLMQRDQRALQQALQQAGLDSARTNLEFSLRQNPFATQGGMGDGRGQQPAFAPGTDLAGDETGAEAATTLYRGTATAGGVNLFV